MSEQETTTEIQPGILAARCPPGWRRDPMTGRPVMPCLGRLFFKCDPDDVPTHLEVRRQLHELFDYTDLVKPCWVNLIGAIIGDARIDKLDGGSGLSQDTERYLADCIDEVLRFRGTVRIVKTGAGWEEVGGAVSSHFPALENGAKLETTRRAGDEFHTLEKVNKCTTTTTTTATATVGG